MQEYIYVVFSSTPYVTGKAIRLFTREQYNHVSISLDPELNQMYGFARRYFDAPLYGGFVKESRCRFHLRGQSSDISICKIPVTPAQLAGVKSRLRQMYRNRELYLYNHMSVLGSLIHRPIRTRGAYTCVEFGVHVLSKLDIGVDAKKFYSVGQLQKQLKEYEIYAGPMPKDDSYDPEYYKKYPFYRGTYSTVRDFIRLFPRLVSK